MFNRKMLVMVVGVLTLLTAIRTASAQENTVTNTVKACVEAKRGADYEESRENALKINKDLLLPVLTTEKKDVPVAEWVVKDALKAWIETPEIGKKCYEILVECEKDRNIKGDPSDWAGQRIAEKVGFKAQPFIYEILFKRNTHPIILYGIINQLGYNTGPNDTKTIPVLIEFLKVDRVQKEKEEYYVVQGLEGKGKWDEPKDAIWSVPICAIRVSGLIGRDTKNIYPLEPLKKLYIDSENMEPYKNIKKLYGVENTVEARRNYFKKHIIEAIERIGQEEGQKALEDLENVEKNDEMKENLSKAKQKVIDKIEEQKKQGESRDKPEDQQPPKDK